MGDPLVSIELSSAKKDNVDDNVKVGTINSVRPVSQKDGEEDTVSVHSPPTRYVDVFNIEK